MANKAAGKKASPGKKVTLVDRIAAVETKGNLAKFESLRAALRDGDDLGAVVRGHIRIEHELLVYIRDRVKPPLVMEHLPWQYERRVNLAIALGLHADLKPALKALGDIRNGFAHDVEANVGADESTKFWNAFSTSQQAWINGVSARLQGQSASQNTFAQTPRGNFNLYAASLYLWLDKINNGGTAP